MIRYLLALGAPAAYPLKRFTILIAVIVCAGCSSFRMGAVCYLPAGHSGACQVEPAK